MQKQFQKSLEEYYNFLIDRFEEGYDYTEKNPTDKRRKALYLEILQEIIIIENLRSFYKNK